MFASVIINVSSSNVDMEFSYKIPSDLLPFVKIGTRVKVPFGQANRIVMGYVLDVTEEDNSLATKEIMEVLDLEPILTKNQIELALFIKKDTICPLVRVLNLMIPDALKLSAVKYIKVKSPLNLDPTLAQILDGKEQIQLTKAHNKLFSKIKKAEASGDLEIVYDAILKTKEKMVTKYKINEQKLQDLKDIFKEDVFLRLQKLLDFDFLTKEEILDEVEISPYVFLKLKKLNAFIETKERSSRVKERQIPVSKSFMKTNPSDEAFFQKFNNLDKPLEWIAKDKAETFHILESVVRKNLNKGKNTLIIVPDILTSYKVSSFIRKKTSISVACLNSKLSSAEELDYFLDIKEGMYPVIVSTPKSSLLEYGNLDAIIMLDTESENYFNDQSPRYDLKRVMRAYSMLYGVKLIYHTYFPLLEEYILATKGEYELIQNIDFESEDYDVEVVNLNLELLKGNDSLISLALKKKINKALDDKKQVMLITNRKYYSNFVMCRSCGNIEKCPKCQIALKYSAKGNQLICPACALKMDYLGHCLKCESDLIRFASTGMEKAKEDLQKLFLSASILMIDDVKNEDLEEKLEAIACGDCDIILTTEVFSKSLYFKSLGLICVLNLDEVSTNLSYNVKEKEYLMLTRVKQIALENNSSLLIQTYDLDSFVLKSFISGNYQEYLKNEISERKKLHNVPFYKINKLYIKGDFKESFKEAYFIKNSLTKALKNKIYIIGPTYNNKEKAVQLIIKHQASNINEYYIRLYKKYQESKLTLIFENFVKYV